MNKCLFEPESSSQYNFKYTTMIFIINKQHYLLNIFESLKHLRKKILSYFILAVQSCKSPSKMPSFLPHLPPHYKTQKFCKFCYESSVNV